MTEMTSEGLLLLVAICTFAIVLALWIVFIHPWLGDSVIRILETGVL